METYQVCEYNLHEVYKDGNEYPFKYPFIGLHKVREFSDIDEARKYANKKKGKFDYLVLLKKIGVKQVMIEKYEKSLVESFDEIYQDLIADIYYDVEALGMQ